MAARRFASASMYFRWKSEPWRNPVEISTRRRSHSRRGLHFTISLLLDRPTADPLKKRAAGRISRSPMFKPILSIMLVSRTLRVCNGRRQQDTCPTGNSLGTQVATAMRLVAAVTSLASMLTHHDHNNTLTPTTADPTDETTATLPRNTTGVQVP